MKKVPVMGALYGNLWEREDHDSTYRLVTVSL